MKSEKNVEVPLVIPRGIMSPLMDICIGGSSTADYILLLTEIPSIYRQFKTSMNTGRVITTRDIENNERSFLRSERSLWIYKTFLDDSEERYALTFGIELDELINMKNDCFLGNEIATFERKGISDEQLLYAITRNSIAYTYWCMLGIGQGRRIGDVGYKNKRPDLDGPFLEFDMQRFFKNYNQLKSLSFDEDDFLCNASKTDIERRFKDYISIFKDYTQKGKNDSASRVSSKLEKYARVLNLNPQTLEHLKSQGL